MKRLIALALHLRVGEARNSDGISDSSAACRLVELPSSFARTGTASPEPDGSSAAIEMVLGAPILWLAIADAAIATRNARTPIARGIGRDLSGCRKKFKDVPMLTVIDAWSGMPVLS